MTLFATTQAATYKLTIRGLIKNSFLFSLALLPKNILFLALSGIPIFITLLASLFLGEMAMMIGMMVFGFIGFSFIILVWTVYAHGAFDKYINDKIEGAVKNRGMHIMTEEEKQAKEERRRKASNVRFANPKKKKPIVSVDEGSTFTPLATTFSRADLQRLADEKEQVKQEIDKEYDDVDPVDEKQSKH